MNGDEWLQNTDPGRGGWQRGEEIPSEKPPPKLSILKLASPRSRPHAGRRWGLRDRFRRGLSAAQKLRSQDSPLSHPGLSKGAQPQQEGVGALVPAVWRNVQTFQASGVSVRVYTPSNTVTHIKRHVVGNRRTHTSHAASPLASDGIMDQHGPQ